MSTKRYIHFTDRLENATIIAIDAFFDAVIANMDLESLGVFDIIQQIDNALPIFSGGVFTNLFKTPFGVISAEQLSSGTKSCILFMYRMKHQDLDWILSVDSMGDNAKKYMFDLWRKDPPAFNIYCTDYVLPYDIQDFMCVYNDGSPIMFSEILDLRCYNEKH